MSFTNVATNAFTAIASAGVFSVLLGGFLNRRDATKIFAAIAIVAAMFFAAVQLGMALPLFSGERLSPAISFDFFHADELVNGYTGISLSLVLCAMSMLAAVKLFSLRTTNVKTMGFFALSTAFAVGAMLSANFAALAFFCIANSLANASIYFLRQNMKDESFVAFVPWACDTLLFCAIIFATPLNLPTYIQNIALAFSAFARMGIFPLSGWTKSFSSDIFSPQDAIIKIQSRIFGTFLLLSIVTAANLSGIVMSIALFFAFATSLFSVITQIYAPSPSRADFDIATNAAILVVFACAQTSTIGTSVVVFAMLALCVANLALTSLSSERHSWNAILTWIVAISCAGVSFFISFAHLLQNGFSPTAAPFYLTVFICSFLALAQLAKPSHNDEQQFSHWLRGIFLGFCLFFAIAPDVIFEKIVQFIEPEKLVQAQYIESSFFETLDQTATFMRGSIFVFGAILFAIASLVKLYHTKSARGTKLLGVSFALASITCAIFSFYLV